MGGEGWGAGRVRGKENLPILLFCYPPALAALGWANEAMNSLRAETLSNQEYFP